MSINEEETQDEVSLYRPPKKRKPGRPWSKSEGNGFLEKRIKAAETKLMQLSETVASLQEDNARQQSALDVYGTGISAADVHLSFLLVSRCAFSRKTRAVLRLEEGNQVSLSRGCPMHAKYIMMTPVLTYTECDAHGPYQ